LFTRTLVVDGELAAPDRSTTTSENDNVCPIGPTGGATNVGEDDVKRPVGAVQ
jgi:hypothetical protein